MREILERQIREKENAIQVVQAMWNFTKQYGDRIGDPEVLEYFGELCREQDQLKQQLEAFNLS
jgi:hypothetical protein